MKEAWIGKDANKLAVSHWGTGPRLLLCLHGYGNDYRIFKFLAEGLPSDVRLVAADLPYFGRSHWRDENGSIDPNWLADFLPALRDHFPETTSLELMGFSLGAKLALGFFQHSPFPLRKICLISPDGLRIHPLYRFCVYNPLGKRIFKAVLRRPGAFLYVLRILHNLRIEDAFKYRFVKRQFGNPDRRAQLQRVWLGYAGIRPDLKRIASLAEAWDTEWHIIWGKKDSVLPPQLGNRFRKKVPGVNLHLVHGGHQLLPPPTDEVWTLLHKFVTQE